MSTSSSLALTFVAALAGGSFGCSSSSGAAAGPQDSGDVGDDAGVYTVLVQGTLANSYAQSTTLDSMGLAAAAPQAQSAGEVEHQAFVNLDPASDAGAMEGSDAGAAAYESLYIDRWTSLTARDMFLANPNVQSFNGAFFAGAPTITSWQPRAGWTTWGSPSDWAPGASNPYVITIHGNFKGTAATAEATHNNFVAMIPSPGPVGLGNIAHMPFANATDDTSTELLIVEVWDNEANQVMAYDQLLPPLLAALWDSPPTITRWRTTPWTRW